jgi:hypothetical protein
VRVPKKQRGVIEVGINPHRITHCAGRPSPSWMAFATFHQLIVFQLVVVLGKLFLAALAPVIPLLRNLYTSKDVEKKHERQARGLVGRTHHLCAGGETASQTKGIDQLREVDWELVSKGRVGEFEKEFEDIRDADDEDNDDSERRRN